jgi:mRNA-degrading endonuclease RelE of RelBE toxin-antitoxin system
VPFQIVYMPDARDHLRGLSAVERVTILDAVDEMLVHEPTVETRHRKALRSNLIAGWELRVGDFRVFFDVRVDDMIVAISAIGIKTHNRLVIGGEEVEL